jgi:hypothetical protein
MCMLAIGYGSFVLSLAAMKVAETNQDIVLQSTDDHYSDLLVATSDIPKAIWRGDLRTIARDRPLSGSDAGD